MPKKSPNNSGFTIVELLIVIVVIAILAAITIVSYNGISDQAAESSLKSDLRNASKQLAADKVLLGKYPASESQANGNKGLTSSESTTLQYLYQSSDDSYCLNGTSTNARIGSFHVRNGGEITEGECPVDMALFCTPDNSVDALLANKAQAAASAIVAHATANGNSIDDYDGIPLDSGTVTVEALLSSEKANVFAAMPNLTTQPLPWMGDTETLFERFVDDDGHVYTILATTSDRYTAMGLSSMPLFDRLRVHVDADGNLTAGGGTVGMAVIKPNGSQVLPGIAYGLSSKYSLSGLLAYSITMGVINAVEAYDVASPNNVTGAHIMTSMGVQEGDGYIITGEMGGPWTIELGPNIAELLPSPDWISAKATAESDAPNSVRLVGFGC